jgi:hypothetical protein
MGKMSNEYKILVGKPEGRRSPRGSRRRPRWEDNIKIDLRKHRVAGCRLDSSG